MARLFGVNQGAVAVPWWFSTLPAAQLFFAILILGLTAYSLSIHSGSQIRPALVLTTTTAVLTILPIFPVTIPLRTALIHPLGTLIANFIGTLLWLASLVALASYHRVFSYYRKVESIPWSPGAPQIARSWSCGVAACVFAAIELLLFVVTLKIFGHFYHHHQANTQSYGEFLRSTPHAPKVESHPLQSTVAAAQHNHHPTHTTSSPTSLVHPTGPRFPSASNHVDYNCTNSNGDADNINVPSITHTAATPTATVGSSFAAASPSSQGHAGPTMPQPDAVLGTRSRAVRRPPYPVDEDEERGAVGSGHHDNDGATSTTAAMTNRGAPVPPVLTPGVSER